MPVNQKTIDLAVTAARALVGLCPDTSQAIFDLIGETIRLTDRDKRVTAGCAKDNEEICQTLGKALGYPWFKDNQVNFPGATEADGVCVGEHVAASIAAEAADRIASLAAQVERLERLACVLHYLVADEGIHGRIASCFARVASKPPLPECLAEVRRLAALEV